MFPTKNINWKKNLFFIWLSQILSLAGFAAIMPFMPIYFREHFGMHEDGERGAWVAAFNFLGMLSFCLVAPLWGKLADRYGRKLMLLRANYVTGFLWPLLALAPNIWVLIVVRLLISSFSGTAAAAQTLVASTTPEKHQGFALGVLSTALWSGNMLGFAAGGIIVSTLGFTWAFSLCGVMYLIGGILIHLEVDEDFHRKMPVNSPENTPTRTRQGYSTALWIVLLLFVMMAVARRFDEPYIAMQIERIHGLIDSISWTGWISAAAALGGIISGVAIGKLCDRWPPENIALTSLVICGTTMLLQAFATNLLTLGTARFLTFLAAGGLEPAFLTLLSRLTPPEKRGTLFGLATSLRMGGILISALLAGTVIFFGGVQWVFLIGAGMFFLPIPLLLYLVVGARESASLSP